MKVWVVTFDTEDRAADFEGVFSSKELAEAAIVAKRSSFGRHWYDVTEWELDAPLGMI